MKIDLFTHFFPARFFRDFIVSDMLKDVGKRVKNIDTIADLYHRFRVMDEFGEYCQLLTLPVPPIETIAPPDRSPEVARIANDGLAALCQEYPERFIGFAASLPMNNLDATAKEMERSVNELGAVGFQIYTNVVGRPLDNPEFEHVFAEAARLDLPIWLHPARGSGFSDYESEDKSKYEIWWALGWPYETSVAMSRMVFSGFFDKWPDLKIITHHMGGMIPHFTGRVGHGWDQLGARTSDVDYKTLLGSMKKRPIEYFRNFYADTAVYGALAAARCSLDFFGLDHVVFASDTPFGPTPGVYIRETISVLENLGLTPDQKDQIYRRNAEKLLKKRFPRG